MLSSESSETLDSFIHLRASSFESHSTTVSPNVNQGTTWKQGRRTPVETSATHSPYDRAHPFGSDPRSSKGKRPTAWRAFSSFLPQQRLCSSDLADSDAGRHGHPQFSPLNGSNYQTESELYHADDQSTQPNFLVSLRLRHPTRLH
jgi:hypothetical protein